MRKKTLEWDRNSAIRSIFHAKKRIKSKGGKSTLAEMHSSKPKSSISYHSPKGLQGDEWKTAMMEVSKGYPWHMSSITPKDDIAKKKDYQGLLNTYTQC